MLRGKAREMGLGSLNAISVQQARGRHSIAGGFAKRAWTPLRPARRHAIKPCSKRPRRSPSRRPQPTDYIDAQRAVWRNAKHAAQWEATLATYAEPIIGGLSVQAIDTGLVLKVLEPIWTTKPETASRLRGRIESVLDWAKVRGYRQGENPARWRGHLDRLLPARSKVRRVEHHAALPLARMPEFMTTLRAQEGTAARALEFAILTAARTGKVLSGQPF
jgi:hypothetical protein